MINYCLKRKEHKVKQKRTQRINIHNFIFVYSLCLLWLTPWNVNAQNNNYNYHYEVVKMDSTYDKNADMTLEAYIQHLKQQKDKKMDLVIGVSKEIYTSFAPASPLSNLLVDMLFSWGNNYLMQHNMPPADMALLNFGGIRAPLPKGNITVGDIYKIAPFDNTVTFITLEGSELKKLFDSFTEKRNASMANVQTVYYSGRLRSFTIGDAPLDTEKIYTIVTINFLALGGDEFLKPLTFETTFPLDHQVRDIFIEEIIKRTAEDKEIEGYRDGRVNILPMP